MQSIQLATFDVDARLPRTNSCKRLFRSISGKLRKSSPFSHIKSKA
jgi:hypothetical protein